MQIATPRFGPRALPSLGALIGIAVAAAVIGAAGFFVYQRLNPPPAPVAQQTARVTRGTIIASVNATGSAQALTTNRLNFKANGRIADVSVSVGDSVKAGQVLARLETSDLVLAVEQARVQVLANQAKLDQIRAGARPEDVTVAQAGLASARAKLEAMQQSRPEEIVAARIQLEAAQAKLDTMIAGGRAEDVEAAQAAATSALAGLQQVRAGALQSDLEASRANLESAQANLRASRAKLEDLLKGPTAADLAAAQSAVDNAHATLENARSKLADLVAPSATDIAAAERAVAAARASLRAATTKREESRRVLDEATTQRPTDLATRIQQMRSDEAAEASARSNLAAAEAKLADLQKAPDAAEVIAAQSAMDGARAGLNSALLKLEQLRAGATAPEMTAAQSAVEAGEANVRSAQAKLNQLLAGPEERDLVAAEASVVQAQAALAVKQAPFTEADLLAQQQAVRQAEANLAARLSPTMEFDIEAQRQSVRQAEANLALKRAPYLPSDILGAEAALEQARVGLATSINNLDGAQIVAPFDGVINLVTMSVGESTSGASSSGSGGGASVTLVDPFRVFVAVQVDESDIARIDLGQPANVTFDALAGRRFPASVSAISPAGTTAQGVVGYVVGLELANPRGVRPGMTAVAEIIHTQRDNALNVPNRAVTRQARDRVVQVVTPTGIESRRVQVGMANDQVTEITEGLNEDDEVVIPTTTARASVPGAGGAARPGGGGFTPGGGGFGVVTGPGR